MVRTVTQLYAGLVSSLALAGLFAAGHLFDLINVDPLLDITRIILAAGLIYAGFVARDVKVAQSVLLFVGMLYVGMGAAGLISPTVWGMLPSGLTGFDVAFHLITGIAATGVAAMDHQDTTLPLAK